MEVTVHFYGHARDVTGGTDFVTELPERSTVRDLLDRAVAHYGEKLRDRLLTRRGELEANVQLFVGERQVLSPDEPLRDGLEAVGEVTIFVVSATAGG